jgi:neutral trehalase
VARTGEFIKVKSVASFLALFAGICDKRQAQILADKLTDPALFGTAFSVPTISKDNPVYGTDMWRGPVWINFNYLILKGLQEYGYTGLHDSLLQSTVRTVAYWYGQEGVIFEFFDSACKDSPKRLNRKGHPVDPYNFDVRMQTIRDYGWSATLYADMVMDNRQKLTDMCANNKKKQSRGGINE